MKRVLVISNNCFSNITSNGRTLGNLFWLYEKDKISQFYISGVPDNSFCSNYYRVSDNDVLSSIIPIKRKSPENSNISVRKKRTVKNMILRNIAWNLGIWKSRKYQEWLKLVDPEIVVLQVGDCAFMINIAMQIARQFKSKLIVYNSEAYYFKTFNYFRDGNDFLYRLFIHHYRMKYKELTKRADKFVFLSDDLLELYSSKFSTKNFTVYNSSSLTECEIETQGDNLTISYFGNLELGRDKSICNIAHSLSELDNTAKIHVYGNASIDTEKLFSKEDNIIFHGFISYAEVITAIQNSNVLLHVESFDDFYIKDSQYGFSGKIADSLCSGRVLLVYAPNNVSCVKYLQKHHVAYTACNQKELYDAIRSVLSYENRRKMAEKQLRIGKQNHDLYKNSIKFIEILR